MLSPLESCSSARLRVAIALSMLCFSILIIAMSMARSSSTMAIAGPSSTKMQTTESLTASPAAAVPRSRRNLEASEDVCLAGYNHIDGPLQNIYGLEWGGLVWPNGGCMDCGRRCNERSDCVAYECSDLGRLECWLSNRAVPDTPKVDNFNFCARACAKGYVPATGELQYIPGLKGIPGVGGGKGQTRSNDQCAAECDEISECRAYLYSETTKSCWFSMSRDPSRPRPADSDVNFCAKPKPKGCEDEGDGAVIRAPATNPWCAAMGGQHEAGSSKCFFIPDDVQSRTRTWIEAENECKQHGGHLASISNAEEQEIVHSLLLTVPAARCHGHVWIGMSDAFDEIDEGPWRNTDGSLGEYSNWGSSQPDDFHGEDCAYMWPSGKWNDARCFNEAPYVCAVDTRCRDSGGTVADNKCFFVPMIGANGTAGSTAMVEMNGTWSEAQSMCEETVKGATLATIHSETDNDVVYALYSAMDAYQNHTAVWIGYSDSGTLVAGASEGRWHWIDGNDGAGDAESFQKWSHGLSPIRCGRDTTSNCAALWRGDKTWDDWACEGENFAAVCSFYLANRTVTASVLPVWTGATEAVIPCDKASNFDHTIYWTNDNYDEPYYYYYYTAWSYDPTTGSYDRTTYEYDNGDHNLPLVSTRYTYDDGSPRFPMGCYDEGWLAPEKKIGF